MRRPSPELIALAAIMVAFLTLAITRERSRVAALKHTGPSSLSYKPDGTRAFFELCMRRGVPAERLRQDLRRIPRNAGMVCMFEPLRNPLTPEERRTLEAWLNRGGFLTLVVEDIPPDSRGYRPPGIQPVATMASARVISVEGQTRLLRDVHRLRVGRGPALLVESGPVRPLISDAYGVIAAVVPVGKGSVLVVSSALAPRNLSIGEMDNAIFWMNVVESRTGARRSAFVDEYHLTPPFRAEDRGRWWRALPAGVQAAAWIGALILLGAIWVGNQRFGSVIEASAEETGPVETAGTLFVVSMARLLRRAACPELAVEYVHHALMHGLSRRFGWEVAEVEDRLAGALSGADAVGEALADAVAHGRSVAQGARTNDEKLLLYAQQVWAIRKELGLDR